VSRESVGSIDIEYQGSAGTLMGRVFGATPDAQYGFYTALEPHTGWALSEAFWTTRDRADSLLTITNADVKQDTVMITLTGSHGEARLQPMTLKSNESLSLWTSGMAQQAGAPANVDSGGLRINGSSHSSKLVVKEHVVDFANSTATPFYGGVVYATSYSFNGSYLIDVGGTQDRTLGMLWSDYSTTYMEDYIVYSNNTSEATWSFNFGLTGYDVTGVAPGDTSLYAQSTTVPVDHYGNQGYFTAQAPITVRRDRRSHGHHGVCIRRQLSREHLCLYSSFR